MSFYTYHHREYFVFVLLFSLFQLSAAEAPHLSSTEQLHCLGNGTYCAFGQGINIESIFGPGYSSPSYLQLTIGNADSTISSRIMGTAIWNHIIYDKNEIIASCSDFIDNQSAILIRTIKCEKEISFKLQILEDEKITIVEDYLSLDNSLLSSILIYKGKGLSIYSDYPYPYEQFQHVLVKGNASIIKEDQSVYSIDIQPGKSEIFTIGGSSFEECEKNTRLILRNPSSFFLNRTKAYWYDYTSRRYNFEKMLPKNFPGKEDILHQIDNVAVILKTQQSVQGGVIAGHRYHLAYVRDQYGVSRGFLAMGYIEEAREILNYYWKIWKGFGHIHNGQAIGVSGIFHEHENDGVEITGYLIIQSFDYLKHSKDTAYLNTIFPMLEWAWDTQKKHLIKGMLPFNGDETYVAGGVLPRSTLNDGSAESTLLFIESGKRLLSFIEENHLWDPSKIKVEKTILIATSEAYLQNFVSDGKIIANNPSRMSIKEMPPFRHGVCAGMHGVLETRKDTNGNYLCPKCLAEGLILPPIERKSYFLPSLALTPEYIGSTLIPKNILEQNLIQIKEKYLQKGMLTSREDSDITIGYEYGLLLLALTKNNDRLAEHLYKEMMDVVDSTGAWVEYYRNGNPMGCNYRPWESAINIEAAILYALSYKLNQ